MAVFQFKLSEGSARRLTKGVAGLVAWAVAVILFTIADVSIAQAGAGLARGFETSALSVDIGPAADPVATVEDGDSPSDLKANRSSPSGEDEIVVLPDYRAQIDTLARLQLDGQARDRAGRRYIAARARAPPSDPSA